MKQILIMLFINVAQKENLQGFKGTNLDFILGSTNQTECLSQLTQYEAARRVVVRQIGLNVLKIKKISSNS